MLVTTKGFYKWCRVKKHMFLVTKIPEKMR